jgi:hypothetical protein
MRMNGLGISVPHAVRRLLNVAMTILAQQSGRSNMIKKKSNFPLRIPDEIDKQLTEYISLNNHLSKNAIIIIAIKEFLKTNQKGEKE